MKVATERVREAAPLPFDLGTLQELCSKKFGLGAQETLDIAQALYETHKLITPPAQRLAICRKASTPRQQPSSPRCNGPMPAWRPCSPLEPQRRSRAWNDAKGHPRHHPHRAPSDPARRQPSTRRVSP